jgi:lipopolysaccharide export system protein LptC
MALDNLHSKFVSTAKIVFPLLALGFLSTIFLFSRTLDPDDAIPFSDVDIEKIAKEQRLAGPKFSGVTSDGSAITVEAESARPDLLNPRRVSADNIMASIKTAKDDLYMITADNARFDGTSDQLDLEGNIQVTSSSGFTLNTQQLTASLGTTAMIAKGAIEGTAPGATIEAGAMELLVKDGAQLLVFTNGVRLVYSREE